MSFNFGQLAISNMYKDARDSSEYPIYRSTPLGNPFSLDTYAKDREVVINLFKDHFLERLPFYYKLLRHFIYTDKDIRLLCFCAPARCHGETYKDFVEFCRKFPNTESVASLVSEYRKHNGYIPLEDLDGVTHVNTYSRGKTDLGRLLSNFSPYGFENEEGKFASIEGYWYWKSTGSKHDELRKEIGLNAKVIGGKFPKVHVDNFDECISKAVRAKITQNSFILEKLLESKLPFVHYYCYGTGYSSLVQRLSYPFMYEFNRLRAELTGGLPTIVAGSRTVNKPSTVNAAILESGMNISKIISGMAKGVDILGWHYGKQHHIDVEEYAVTKEEWKASKAAGHIRNAKMEKVGKQGILLIDNYSSGSEGMLKLLETNKKPVYLKRF